MAVLRRDGIQDKRGLTRGALSFCLRVGVPNVCYEHHSACGMVAVAAVLQSLFVLSLATTPPAVPCTTLDRWA